jgi:hypothetical protein
MNPATELQKTDLFMSKRPGRPFPHSQADCVN